jgi:hypothetical protein
MLDVLSAGGAQVSDLCPAEPAVLDVREALATQPRLVLHSRLPGRERWYVNLLENNPRLAAAVELVLRSEEGVAEARANPLTGRVLVRYRPDAISEPVERLLRRALKAGPMSPEEFAALRPENSPGPFSKHLFTAEVACSLSDLVIFGGLCPLGIAATVVLLLLHRGSKMHSHG